MAQSGLPDQIADDLKGFIPKPVRKLWDKYSGAVDKVKDTVSKPYQMNWKPEANDEQKAQIKKEQQKPVARKKMPRKR